MNVRGAISRGAVLLFLVLAAHQAAKPLHLDNVDFPAVAEATAHSGKPVYYRGEENRLHSGLYHPPLYIYTLAAWFRLFGSGPAQARMFGALCALLQGWLALQILRLLFGSERVRQWRWLFWLLFLLNPYTLQVSAIADIDSTVYGPLLGLVLFSALRIGWQDGRWRDDEPRSWELGLVALALTAALWAKLTTVLLLFPFLFLLFAPRLGWKRGALVTLGVSAAGLGGFALTYCLYGVLTGLDVGYTFQFLKSSMLGPGRLLSYRANLRTMVPFMVRWTGLLPWLSVAVLLAATGRRWWDHREPRALYSFWLLSLAGASVVYYCGQVMSFGGAPFKYTFVFWALLSCAPVILVAWLWESEAKDGDSRFLPTGAALWLAGLWIGAVAVQDVLVGGSLIYPQTASLWVPASAALAGLLAWTIEPRRLGRLGAGLAIGALLLHAGLQAGIALYQSRVDYSTTYDYGQRGLQETAAFIAAHTTERDVISSMKDVGFLAKRRYYENYSALFDDASAARLIAAWESGKVGYIVFTEGRGQDQLFLKPALRDWIAGNAEQTASFGNYRIYRPKALAK
ncbi:MAG TPA: glycosyltransferase family 39 protein [Thermoanaerobaculia bacterium]|nr:glycosyltransferase family 39 protein [Thermoanaerobaculia bacterium]